MRWFWRKTAEPERVLPNEVICEKTDSKGRTAALVRKDGQIYCRCPYLCMAASETCEFDDLRKQFS